MVLVYFQKANDKGLGAEIWNDVLLHAMHDVADDGDDDDEIIDAAADDDDDDDIGRKSGIHENNNGFRVLVRVKSEEDRIKYELNEMCIEWRVIECERENLNCSCILMCYRVNGLNTQ